MTEKDRGAKGKPRKGGPANNGPVNSDEPLKVSETLSPDATDMLVNIMQVNASETARITNAIIDSLQSDLDEARDEVKMIRANVLGTLYRPHTDFDIRHAVYADHYLRDDEEGPS